MTCKRSKTPVLNTYCRNGEQIAVNSLQGNQVVNNDGEDQCNLGRPILLVDNLRPTIDEYTYKIFCIPATTSNMAVISLGGGVRQNFITQLSTFWSAYIGNTLISTTKPVVIGQKTEIIVSASLSAGYIFVNGEVGASGAAIGSSVSSSDYYINGPIDGGFVNYEGLIWGFDIRKGSITDAKDFNSLERLEYFPLNEGSGTESYGVNGTVGTWVDGAPETLWKLKLSPDQNDPAKYMLIDDLGNIYPNPGDWPDITLATTWTSATNFTPVNFSLEHNGTTIFISDPAQRVLVTDTAQTGDCQTRANRFVYR